jgi:hypothetical protein
MHDQSHGRINGSAAAAFATICERRLNMASVLKSAGEFRRRAVGMRRRFKIRQEIGTNNFLNDISFVAPFHCVGVGQPPQDNRDSTHSRRFTLLLHVIEKSSSTGMLSQSAIAGA